jgi:hypothetical protein
MRAAIRKYKATKAFHPDLPDKHAWFDPLNLEKAAARAAFPEKSENHEDFLLTDSTCSIRFAHGQSNSGDTRTLQSGLRERVHKQATAMCGQANRDEGTVCGRKNFRQGRFS